MLTPDYYETCVDDILKLYAQLEDDIISDIIRRMMKTGIVTESAKHQAEMLQNAGLLYDDILSEIAKRTDATSQQVKALFEDAGVRTVNFDNEIYRAVGRVPVDIRQSPAMRQTLESGYRKTLGNMQNLTLTTANMAQSTYYSACNQAYMQVVSGAFSYQEAIKKAIQKTAQDGAFVLYPSGHRDRVDVAVRRSVLTGVGQTCREIGLMNAEENDCDLMELSAHFGARPTHAEWQGQIVSLSGRKGYLSLDSIGYGTGDGFGGWNCRHDWFPYFEGYSRRNYTDNYLKSLNEKNIEYNGEKYSQYEISQIQRKYEREIRSAKREKVAFDTAVKESSDPELKAVMKSGSDYANQQIKDKQAKMRDFINQTGQSRDYFREQNYGKVVYPKNNGNSLTSVANGVKIKDIGSGIFVKTRYFTGELKYYAITSERINNIKPIKLNSLSDENNQKLTDACKDLLLTMKDAPLGTEGLIAFDINMNEITRYSAIKTDSSVKLMHFEKDYIIIHNHPDDLILSEGDIRQFLKNENLITLGAVGHNSSLWFISKKSDYDYFDFYDYIDEIRKKYSINLSPEEHIKFIEEVLEDVKEHGVEFFKG